MRPPCAKGGFFACPLHMESYTGKISCHLCIVDTGGLHCIESSFFTAVSTITTSHSGPPGGLKRTAIQPESVGPARRGRVVA